VWAIGFVRTDMQRPVLVVYRLLEFLKMQQ
jgi:hypothetical protein